MFNDICEVINKKDSYITKLLYDIDRLFYIDAYTVIFKGRIVAERLVKLIIDEGSILNADELNQKDRINLLENEDLITEEIAKALHAIRVFANKVIHDEVEGIFEISLLIIRNLYKVLSWYVTKYINHYYEIIEYIEPDIIGKIYNMEGQVRNVMNMVMDKFLVSS